MKNNEVTYTLLNEAGFPTVVLLIFCEGAGVTGFFLGASFVRVLCSGSEPRRSKTVFFWEEIGSGSRKRKSKSRIYSFILKGIKQTTNTVINLKLLQIGKIKN